MTDYRFSCPSCGKKTTIVTPFGNPPITASFCNDCGSKMRFLGAEEISQVVTNEKGELIGVKTTDFIEREKAEAKSTFLFIEGKKNPKIMEFVDNEQIKTPWTVDVQESKQFIEFGLVVAKNAKGKRIHLKKGAKQIVNGQEFTELIPLTIDELKSMKIEESLNEQLFDLTIEESSEEPASKKFNSQDLESMREAKRLAELRIKELGGSTETESETNEEKQIVDDIKEKLSLQLAGKGIEINPEEIKTQADLERWVGVIKKLEKPKDDQFRAEGGTAPLSQGQGQEIGWSSYPEMIDSIRDKASPLNPDMQSRKEAQKVLDALLTKALRGQEEARKPFSYAPKEGDKGTLEILRDKYQRRKKIARGIE